MQQTTKLICSLTADSVEAMRADMQAAAAAGADAVECRLDYLPKLPDEAALRRLLRGAPLPVIVTCRPARQGGRYEGEESARLGVLAMAGECGATYIDVEADVSPSDRPGGTKVILSHHNFDSCPNDLDDIAADLDSSGACMNKIVFAAAGPEDALQAFDCVRNSRKPTIALAMGEAGVMSRILARKFGAAGTFAALSAGAQSAPGQPTIEQFKRLYRWDALGPKTNVYGVIGCPVGHSMSPAIHNAAFDAAGIDAVYVPLLIQPGAENFNRFMDALANRPWVDLRGLSVTIPHKENALAYVGEGNCDELAARIGAINTITIGPHGKLRGDNTDYAAALGALCEAMGIAPQQLAGVSVAVLGAGGAGRAIVAALAARGADVTIYNRTVSRAEALGGEFGCRWARLDEAESLDASVVINCTPIGMHPKTDATPLPSIPQCVEVVFDTIYNPLTTRLLADAARAGCRTVSGLEMFVNQAVRQFEIWTRRPAPRETMRRVVVDRLSLVGK